MTWCLLLTLYFANTSWTEETKHMFCSVAQQNRQPCCFQGTRSFHVSLFQLLFSLLNLNSNGLNHFSTFVTFSRSKLLILRNIVSDPTLELLIQIQHVIFQVKASLLKVSEFVCLNITKLLLIEVFSWGILKVVRGFLVWSS